MNKIKVIIYFFLAVSTCFSQDFKSDMLKMNKITFLAKNLSYKLQYNMYLDGDLSVPFQQREVKIVRSQPFNLVMKDDNMSEVIINKNAQLIINHKHKYFLLKPHEIKPKDSEVVYDMFSNAIDTLLRAYKKITSVKISEDIVQYDCFMLSGVYKKIVIQINQKTHLPVKVVYHHKFPITKNANDHQKHSCIVEVFYNEFNLLPNVSENLFSHKKYVYRKGDTYLATNTYSNYKFINLFEDSHENKN